MKLFIVAVAVAGILGISSTGMAAGYGAGKLSASSVKIGSSTDKKVGTPVLVVQKKKTQIK